MRIVRHRYKNRNFTYDGLGRRTKKINGSTTITYSYDSDGRLIKQSDGLEFIYDASGVVGIKYSTVEDGKTVTNDYFYRKDAQGNIIAILDSNGDVVVKYVYDAWGNHGILCLNYTGLQDINDEKLPEFDDEHLEFKELGILNPFRYRGYYYDTETELYFLQTRYYDPEVCRFISQDSVEYADPNTINGLNLYAYCVNNPVMYTDPSGRFVFTTAMLIGLLIGAAIGAVAGGYIAGEKASEAGATGWELFGWTLLGVVGGGIAGGAIGMAAGWAAPALSGLFSGSLALAGGGTVSTGVAVAEIGLLGLNVWFAKRTGKEGSTDKPSWVKQEMVDFEKSPQQNAADMLNNKYGPGNWKEGPGSEFSKIKKWIARTLFFWR